MSSGTSSISGAAYQYGTVYCSYSASFWETNVDNDANTSTVSWSGNAYYSHSEGYSFSGTTRDAAGIMRIYVNGGLAASYNVPLTSGIGNGGRLMSCSGTSSAIAHNDDGTKSVSCRVDVNSGSDPLNGGWVYSSSTGSTDNLNLTSIPRASKPTINTPNTSNNTFELGTTITIYTNRKLTGAKHTVIFKYNSTSVTVGTAKAVEDSVTYNTGNIAAAFLNANPNATQLTGTIEVTTFNSSGTQVGSVQSINYTATIPDSYGPTMAFPSGSITETALNNVGVAAKTIVRYISKKKFKITVTPKNNATTVQVILKDGSNIRYLTQSDTTTTWTGEFTGLETNNISFQATDSRGKVSSLAMTGLTLVPYIKPTIQNAYLTRVNASTGANSELTVYGAYYNGTIGSVTNTITVKYTISGESQQTIPANSVTYHDGVYNAVGIVGTLAPDTSYTCNVIATDAFNQPISIDISIASVHDVLWLGKKTVRVHDYLIADQDVWLNDGETKLSNFCDRNLVNYAAWSRARSIRCTPIWENNGVTITATGEDAYTLHGTNAGEFPVAARIPVTPGKTYIMTWDYSGSDPGATANACIFPNGLVVQGEFVEALYTAKQLSYTAKSDHKFITWRFGVHDSGSTVSYKNVMIRESTRPNEYMQYNGLLGIKMQTIHWDSVSISSSSCTNIYFDLPRDFNRSLGCKIYYSWPLNNWNSGATVTIRADATLNCGPLDAGKSIHVGVTSVSAQNFVIDMILYYI